LTTHRVVKNLTQEKAAHILNINVRYIKDLEKDNYKELPADVYTMNILKRYAELLDLNPYTVIDLFNKEKNIFIKTQKKTAFETITLWQRLANIFLNPKLLKYSAGIIILSAILSYIGWGITRIISPPRLSIDSPADNLIIKDHAIEIKGSTEKEVNLTINNRLLLSDKDGNFSLNIDLQTGLNVINITAKKKYSKEQTIIRKIIVESDLK